MRRLPAFTLLAPLVLVLPASAQAQDPTTTSFTMEPIDAPIMPLGGEVVRNYTADLFCPTLPGGALPSARECDAISHCARHDHALRH